MLYETFGIREFRKNLSSLLSAVERNQQRVLVGKNSDVIAAVVPLSDLKKLDEFDELEARNLLESEVLQVPSQPEEGAKVNADELFNNFVENKVDESRYEDENDEELLENFDASQTTAFRVLTIQHKRSPTASFLGLPEKYRELYRQLYIMIDEAVACEQSPYYLHNLVASCLSQNPPTAKILFSRIRPSEQESNGPSIVNLGQEYVMGSAIAARFCSAEE